MFLWHGHCIGLFHLRRILRLPISRPQLPVGRSPCLTTSLLVAGPDSRIVSVYGMAFPRLYNNCWTIMNTTQSIEALVAWLTATASFSSSSSDQMLQKSQGHSLHTHFYRTESQIYLYMIQYCSNIRSYNNHHIRHIRAECMYISILLPDREQRNSVADAWQPQQQPQEHQQQIDWPKSAIELQVYWIMSTSICALIGKEGCLRCVAIESWVYTTSGKRTNTFYYCC